MVTAVMPKGLKVSIKFTPQAQDDLLSFTEDSGGVGYDYDTGDLLTNDLATGAARIWGIFAYDETHVQNNIGTLVTNTAANGDTSFAVGAVCVEYDAETGDITISFDSADFDYLAVGESTVVGSFTYVIRMANGAFSTAVANIEITGQNDGPTINAYTAGSVIEDSESPVLSATGTITFDDPDINDTHTVTDGVSDSGNALGGALTASVTHAATGIDQGTVTWNYSVANSATQYLAKGETAVEKFTVTISDNHGSSIDQEIAVTVTGVNDEVTIVADATDAAGAVTEDDDEPTLTDGGSIAFTDVDLADGHTADWAKATGTLGGSLSLGPVSEAAGAAGGTVAWTYAVANANVQHLAQNETAAETFTVIIDDLNGDTVEQTVSVEVTGVNDEVTIVADATDAAGALTEDDDEPTLTDGGTIAFTDVDLADKHTADWAKATGTLGGSLSLGPVSEAADAAGGSVAWTYTVANANVQHLAQNETAAETFTVIIDDLNGDTVEQTVSVEVTGVNDEVTIVADATDAAGAVTEDDDEPTLTDGGSIAFTDVDLADGHTADWAKATGTLGGSLSLGPVSEAADAAGGSVAWTYTVANANVQHLAQNETAAETFTVIIDDLNGDTVEQTVSIEVTGVNDTPTDLVLDHNVVAENSAAGTTVGLLSTADVDSIDTHSYSIIGGSGSGLFAIDGNAIDVDGALDFESANSYTLVIRTTDNHLAFYDETFTISVTDVNEVPSITSNGAGATAAISIAENTTAVTTVVAADPDLGGGNDASNSFENVTYSITGGADQPKFTIDANTGVLAFLTAPDFEARADADQDNVYDVVVTATDGGFLSDSQAIAVTVTDLAEGPLPAPQVFIGTGDPNDNDTLLAASAGTSVTVVSQGSADVIHGTNNADTVNAGSGGDTVYGHDGADAINGQQSPDISLYGQKGDDQITGGNGGDEIYGGSGDDTIYGGEPPALPGNGSGSDTIYGGSGSDTIYGQDDADIIIGGYGADTLTGGSGADTFVYLSNNDTGDTITDFQIGSDKIDLTALSGDALGAAAGTTLVANSANWYYDGSQTVVQVDDNNDTANVDLQIYLVGNQTLTAADFLL